MRVTRAAKIRINVLERQDILTTGHETAMRLWNYTYWCAVGHNRRLAFQRGDIQVYGSLAGKLPKYTGRFGMEKELRDDWRFANLSDRCASSTVKDFDTAMRSWFSNLKSNPDARPPRTRKEPRMLTFEVGRNAKHLGNWNFRLTVLGGHIKERHAIIHIFVRPGLKVKQVKLIRVNPDLTGTIVYYDESSPVPGKNVAAVDLGIINIACLAFNTGESILYNGHALLDILTQANKRASKCKPKGWAGKGNKKSKPSKRRNSYLRKGTNKRKLAVHNMTRSIIDECVARKVGTLVVGDLTGIRKNANHGKAGNQKLHQWPFREIRRQLEYKGENAGIEVVAVSEKYTSKTCGRCGSLETTRNPRGLVKCKDCGFVVNSDVNGAFNILKKVSPGLVLGVGADFPSPPSPTDVTLGTGKAEKQPVSQIGPTYTARFDLRDWSIHLNKSGYDRLHIISSSQ